MTGFPIPPLRLAAALLALAACGSPRPGPGAEETPRQAGAARASRPAAMEYVVDTAEVDLPLRLPAQLYVEHDAVVVARASGTVDSLFADLGDRVRAGQLLARIESVDQQIVFDSAQAAYATLQRAAARARALSRSGGVTSADSEQVELQLATADIARRRAQRDLELTRVTAPFDGVVAERFVRPRRYVRSGDTLFRVAEAGPLYARVHVPAASAHTLAVGQSATVLDVSGMRAAAIVVNAAPAIDAASGTREFVVRVRGEGAAVRQLASGASVTVEVGHERRRVVTVAREALAAGGYAVVIENGRTTLRPVSIGRDLGGGRVEVTGGLAPGEHLARPER